MSRHARRPRVLIRALVPGCLGLAALAAGVPADADARAAQAAAFATLDQLGQALFHDVNLSRTRTQSCASCHDPARAFSEPATGRAGGAVSTSADGTRLGVRNAPPLTYAALVPGLHRDAEGHPAGGLFHDGRADDLAAQALQPILDPVEMQMPDAAAVVARVRENPGYVRAFRELLGVDLHGVEQAGEVAQAFGAIGQALAAFERTPAFVAFDSRYDRALRGEIALDEDEAKGRDLFFSALTNCSRCHLLDTVHRSASEPFTSHRYFNIGTPPNHAVRAINGQPPGAIDAGLAGNPAMASPAHIGMFRVPSLRNVAVTGPYMHNGVFRELSTVVFFYNQYQGRSAAFMLNPETGEPWDAPEVPGTIDSEHLRAGQPMEADRIALILAFLRALTDRRFEHLLAE